MTSKNSIYKMTLEHLRHSGWMVALSFIGNLIAGPVVLLFAFSNNDYSFYEQNYEIEKVLLMKARDTGSYLSSLCGSMLLAVSMIGALIVALGIFYYLFQSSKIDLYHSLPLTRSELFYSGYLAGFIIWFVPFIISSVITLPLAFICAGGFQHINMIIVAYLKMLVFPLIGFIITYHLCLLGVMLSGNMANAVVAIPVFGLAPIVFYGLFTVHFEQYFETFYQFALDASDICAFSPIATPIVIQAFQIDEVEAGLVAFQTIIGLIIAVLNFFVAKALYKTRKSELAGRGMENKVSSFLIRFVASFAAGSFGVLLLFLIGISRNGVVWSILFCLFFTCFTSAVLSAIQKKTVKGLFAHKGQMIASMALAVGFILVCRFDVFGYDTYLPKKENIESVEIRINAISNYYYYGANQYLFEYTDTDVIYELLQAGVENSPYTNATSVVVKVNPKSGFSYYRSYSIPVNRVETLRPIIEDESYFNFLYTRYDERSSDFESMYISDLNYNHFDVVNPQQAQAVWQAYLTDLKEHASMEDMTEYINVGSIDFSITESSSSHFYLPELPISSDFKHTIALLKEYYPHLIFEKSELDVETLHVSANLREELSLGEYYLEHLMESEPTELVNSVNVYGEQVTIVETTEYSEYVCEFAEEELFWLYDFIHPCRQLEDRLNADNYAYLGELELRTGNRLSCYIEKGAMTEEEIKTLAAMVEKSGTLTEY